MIRIFILSILFVSLTLTTLRAISPTQYENAAQRLTDVLVERGVKSVALGNFDGDAEVQASMPGYRMAFVTAFNAENAKRRSHEKANVELSDQAPLRIDGQVTIEDDPSDLGSPQHERFLVVKTTMTLFEGNEEIFPITFYFDRSRDIVQAAGLGLALQADDTRRIHQDIRSKRQSVVRNERTFVVDSESQIKNSAASPYAVEIMTKSPVGRQFKPRRPAKEKTVTPFVPIGVGEIYAVKFHNDSEREVAIGLKIDGIDQFQFSEDRDEKTGRPKYTHWIVRAGQSLLIQGWHLTSAKSDANIASFVVTQYGKGAAQPLNRPDESQDGVITLSVSHSHDPKSGSAKSNAQTGFGPPVAQNQIVVRRKIDPPHEFFAIRYSR